MKRILLLSIILSCSTLFSKAQGTLVEDTIIQHLNFNQITDIFVQNGLPVGLLPTDYEVDVHRVIYNTPDVDGSPTVASGLICLPTGDTCQMPMMTYLHGTKVKKQEAFYYLSDEWSLGVIVATSGYAMCLPDYLGLGAGPGIHPYQHARSEATASVDILRACRIICEQEEKELNGQLFIVGYSQGGHAVMATHRMIQEELSEEFTVTASAPGSGPYDMSGAQLDMVASFDPYAQPGYLPYLIQSYQHVYGNLYDSLQQIYVMPYDETLPPLLDGNSSMGQLNQVMPTVPRLIFQQDYQDAFFSDTLHPAYVALKDNNVYEWVPEAPVMFNYCRSDEEVSYLNTIVASEYMIAHGATDIQVVERDTVIGHFECAQPSILFSKLWFDTMADMCGSGVGIESVDAADNVSMFPNPCTDRTLHFSNKRSVGVSIMDITGKIVFTERTVNPNGVLSVGNLQPGIFIVELRDEDKKFVQRLIVQ
ncbi:MAG: T9SS type A sorting domain-containing protein [Flavobacteriales bacterium]|nr:T9SS type A sorting domain-containing protein [Flavobacteriales bacterium]